MGQACRLDWVCVWQILSEGLLSPLANEELVEQFLLYNILSDFTKLFYDLMIYMYRIFGCLLHMSSVIHKNDDFTIRGCLISLKFRVRKKLYMCVLFQAIVANFTYYKRKLCNSILQAILPTTTILYTVVCRYLVLKKGLIHLTI